MATSERKIVLADAAAVILARERRLPLVSNYDLACILFRLYKTQTHDSRQLRITRDLPIYQDLVRLRANLVERGFLVEDRALPRGLYRQSLSEKASAEELACAADPFSYISHLSAMQHYSLTNRLPKIIFLTVPEVSLWRTLAKERMEKDLGDNLQEYISITLPTLSQIGFDTIGKTKVYRVKTGQRGGYRTGQDNVLRIATIGRTFLDMLRRAELCGGMVHVMEVFEQHAHAHLSLIIDELEQHGSPIDLVRCGYILTEKCGIDDPRISKWERHAQRGGSRKLDPQLAFAPTYSKRWSLSINI